MTINEGIAFMVIASCISTITCLIAVWISKPTSRAVDERDALAKILHNTTTTMEVVTSEDRQTQRIILSWLINGPNGIKESLKTIK